MGRPAGQDGVAERVVVARRPLAAGAHLARVVARRRPPDRPPHRRPHGHDRGPRGRLLVRGGGRRGHRRDHPRRRPRSGGVGSHRGRLARQLVHAGPGGIGGHRGGGGHLAVPARAALAGGGGRARPLRPRRHPPPDRRTARDRVVDGPQRQSRSRPGLPVVHLLRPSSDPVPLANPGQLVRSRPDPGGGPHRLEPAGRTRSRRRPGRGPTGRLRGRAGALPVGRRHRDPHVPHPGGRHRPRTGHGLRAHRLRRVLGHHGPGLQRRHRVGVRRRRPLRGGQHPRRRRGGRGLAPGRHARAQAAQLRRLHRRRRLAGRHPGAPRGPGWPSAAAATAAC